VASVARGELRVGIDVGTTNVDAVALDDQDHVVARAKVPTVPGDPAAVRRAVARLAAERGVEAGSITRAMLGSGALRDAVRSRRGLRRVAVIRIGAPLTLALPPLSTWPAPLRAAVSAGEVVVCGGARYDGQPGDPFDAEAVARFLARVADRVQAVAVTGVFSPVAPEHELAAGEVARRELGAAVPISLSHEIGSLGLLERENATVLNAALVHAARELATDLSDALDAHGVRAELFFAQNDGTVMTLEHLLRFPVLMFGSGHASAMRGAAWLSGVTDGVVVDAGGARIDVCLLVNGFPREAPPPIEIAGVQASFRTPDVLSLPFGGGTVVQLDGGRGRLAKRNVGGRLADRALVFGGSIPTLTDAVVAAGRARVGSQAVPPRSRAALVVALADVDAQLAEAIDRAKGWVPVTSLVVVGGAGALVPADLPDVGEVIAPADGALASAIGLAIAPAGGQAERICANRPADRRRALEAARAEAFSRAVHAGADAHGVEILEIDEIALTYMSDPAIRIRVKAVGPRT
jgi:N-methylhydantoinase A/oxoprolinase/acetone carboxylase beta subunit